MTANQKTFWIVLLFLILLAACLCSGCAASPQRLTVIAPKHYFLMWDYPAPLPDGRFEFDIERTSDFKTWQRIARVPAPPVEIQPGFYRVGAHYK